MFNKFIPSSAFFWRGATRARARSGLARRAKKGQVLPGGQAGETHRAKETRRAHKETIWRIVFGFVWIPICNNRTLCENVDFVRLLTCFLAYPDKMIQYGVIVLRSCEFGTKRTEFVTHKSNPNLYNGQNPSRKTISFQPSLSICV